LLRLEIHSVIFFAPRAFLSGSRESRIIRNISGHTGSFRDVGAELEPVRAGVVESFIVSACFAKEKQCLGWAIFFRIEKVGTFLTEAICYFAAFAFALAWGWGCRCRHGGFYQVVGSVWYVADRSLLVFEAL